jgi:heptosyltransferase-1
LKVLLVKMSSLGDVVHALPAVTDAAAHGVEFHWVVEEAFADIPACHPAVSHVLPIGWRRWRRSLLANRQELRAFISRLRAEQYDLVLDAQGLIKSGIVTGLARGRAKAGFAQHSAREGGAALFYERRIPVPGNQHAIDRLRQLFAAALGYELPAALDFGITDVVGQVADRRECVLLHGTTWASKHYPETMWIDLARRASESGLSPVVPWGNALEQARAERISAAVGGTVLGPTGIDELIKRVGSAALAVGVDSGLAHLSAALGVPTVVIYGSTNATLTGCRGPRAKNLQAEFSCAPCLARSCSYVGGDQQWQGEAVQPPCYSRVAPDLVWQAAMEVMNADRVLSV